MSAFYAQGRYRCEMIKQGLVVASTGNSQIVWRFKVLETEGGDQLPAQYERTIYRTITEKTMPYVVEDLATLGFEHESFKYLDPATPGYQDFTRTVFTAFCTHEDDPKGGQREKWGIANETGFEVKPLEPSKLRELDSLFGKHLKQFKGSAPANSSRSRAAVAEAPPHAPTTDDDVPF